MFMYENGFERKNGSALYLALCFVCVSEFVIIILVLVVFVCQEYILLVLQFSRSKIESNVLEMKWCQK